MQHAPSTQRLPPSQPHVLPSHPAGHGSSVHTPATQKPAASEQVPQDPPQPSSPQVFPAHEGAQHAPAEHT
jgi:hypothetical protein